MTRILLTSAFKPFGVDSHFSRRDSRLEIFHTGFTRPREIFSCRGFFNSPGLHVIANNISAQSTVLEYPTYKRFLRELSRDYDYVGIGSVVANFRKVRVMTEAVRDISPRTKIVVGGFLADVDNVRESMPIDYLCKGEGISFMRDLLGDSPEFEFKNPDIYRYTRSILGGPLFSHKIPQIVIGLGCADGNENYAPFHHFGREQITFFKTGEEIFREMERMERRFNSRTLGFMGDDDFLADSGRADQLRELIARSGKQYEIFFTASVDSVMEFGAERMAQMGTDMVWMGRDSIHQQGSGRASELKDLIKDLHRHGTKVALSITLLMEHHTPDNIWEDVENHISSGPDFTMFEFNSASPGTPYYEKQKNEDKILWGQPYEEWNWQGWPHSYHPHFTSFQGRKLRELAVEREHHALGPSIMRLILTDLEGCLHMRESENPSLRRRAEHLAQKMSGYRAVLWAMVRLAPTAQIREMVEDVLGRVEQSFGSVTFREKAEGLGGWALGTRQKILYRLAGDVIQPPTTVTIYPGPK